METTEKENSARTLDWCTEQIVALLKERGQTVTVAESCTGGGIGAQLTAVSGASAVFFGGVIVYSNAEKEHLLRVDPQVLAQKGAVSDTVVEQMAQGAKALFGADYALSVSGLAGPGGATEHKPVGLVYLGLAVPNGTVMSRKCFFSGDRAQVRAQSIEASLCWLYDYLCGPSTTE